MRVAELLSVKNSKIGNRRKADIIARLQRAAAKRANPGESEIPTGWNASPFPGSAMNRMALS
jgi:hypothetical protein